MTAADVFRRIVGALDASGVPYMLAGSFASAFHGVPRATQDIDLVVAPTADQLRSFLLAARGGLLRRPRRARPRRGVQRRGRRV